MTPEDLSQIHAACFTTGPRPWSAAEFRDLLDQPTIHLITAPHGFALIRVAGPEAELLTIAVAPEHRRQGIARNLLTRLEADAKSANCEEVILEVAEHNHAALALYQAQGFAEVGFRKNYYADPSGRRVTALVLRKVLD